MEPRWEGQAGAGKEPQAVMWEFGISLGVAGRGGGGASWTRLAWLSPRSQVVWPPYLGRAAADGDKIFLFRNSTSKQLHFCGQRHRY